MDLATALRDRLLSDSAVAAIVGDRVYWVERPQGDPLPALVLSAVGGTPDDLDLSGAADFSESRVQCSAFSSSYLEARALAKAATDSLMGASEVGTEPDALLFWDADRDRPVDLGDDTSEGFVYQVAQDVILRHSPSA